MNMDCQSTHAPDWSSTSADYARHRAGFPDELFHRLAGLGVAQPGVRVLDLGTGTGTLALGLAGWGAVVTGIDVAEGQLLHARRAARRAGIDVRFLEAPAEETGLPDASFDVVTAGQCWHWFDRARAAAEVRRVLVPGGRVVIAHFDFRPGRVVDATLAVVKRHRRTPKHAAELHSVAGFYPAWIDDLEQAGFVDVETFSFDVDTPYTKDAWRGRMRASAWIGASLAPREVDAFDDDLAHALGPFPEPLSVPHRVFVVHGRTPR